MSAAPEPIMLPTRRLDLAVVDLLKSLTAGERIRITQTVRVGARSWPAVATGTYRDLDYLSTGVTVDRVAADDVVVPILRFTKENGELTSVSIDENTRVERVG